MCMWYIFDHNDSLLESREHSGVLQATSRIARSARKSIGHISASRHDRNMILESKLRFFQVLNSFLASDLSSKIAFRIFCETWQAFIYSEPLQGAPGMAGEISQSSLSSHKGLPMSHKVPLKVYNNPLPGQKGLLSCHKGPQGTLSGYIRQISCQRSNTDTIGS